MDWLLAEDDKILILHYSLYLVSCLDGGGSRDVQLLEEESKDKPLGIHGTVFHGRVDVACILAKELNEWTGRMLVTVSAHLAVWDAVCDVALHEKARLGFQELEYQPEADKGSFWAPDNMPSNIA
ncbi:hypothetical protein DIZ76_013401 [Coccidioides immitis]|nr:hypothetical protein CIRG_03526 [Coccidioides immitis RMSCC 2394]TPX24058.1 hypothetical protein DIZ76_013401 [Coccidioides immitis]